MNRSHLHFMGIGGSGISSVAQIAHNQGEIVTGCDRQESANTRALAQVGIPIQIGHSAEHLHEADSLIISPAVPALDPQNPELLEARRRGIPVKTWQELLGTLTEGKCLLSVCGVHGKSSTTSMLSLMLVDAGLDPTCEIGAVVPRFGANYRLGQSDYFVNEADEFNHNFWHYHPRLAVVNAIEFEHPEFFSNYEDFLYAFEHFIRGMDMESNWSLPTTIIVNGDSPGCHELCARLNDWTGTIVEYSIQDYGARQGEGRLTFEAYDIQLEGETSFRVRLHNAPEGMTFPEMRFHLPLPGIHYVQNALAALAAAYTVGIDASSIARTLEGFTGARRRFEIRHQGDLACGEHICQNVLLVDDYAHHPTAIALTLEAARKRYPGRRVVAVYQPHMYSRTKTFFNQFLEAFDSADIAILSDIFPAREVDTGLIHTRQLVEAIEKREHFNSGQARILYGGNVRETAALLQETLLSDDIVLLMGAGDVYTITEMLKQNRAPGRA
ncbi:UDP-N-acetylmuramate--L-alanine ligase [Ktedonospora formicarum]|uniref:UDP-N-acetylmuramate--L-alanine ligase n=1 Tax=Ktedonospora formicarum TaxID=2778364 RepID=A0A8J3HXC4_9CHLR|nr:UDP-N-acetylmuramate--L-alanine ligase [Ktedonospora formicarum]GHO43726.1 UDP-N-acetylmuramate--L-alanine ligase [Ktedonospora formicarum]